MVVLLGLTKKRLEKNENYTRILHTVLNKFYSKQLYRHLSPISQNMQLKHAGHGWATKDKFIGNIYLWTLTLGHTSFS